jgi:hypothetical protein
VAARGAGAAAGKVADHRLRRRQINQRAWADTFVQRLLRELGWIEGRKRLEILREVVPVAARAFDAIFPLKI